MVLIRMGASLWVWDMHHNSAGSKIKPQPQVRGAQLQLASRKGETYWKDIEGPVLDTCSDVAYSEPSLEPWCLLSFFPYWLVVLER